MHKPHSGKYGNHFVCIPSCDNFTLDQLLVDIIQTSENQILLPHIPGSFQALFAIGLTLVSMAHKGWDPLMEARRRSLVQLTSTNVRREPCHSLAHKKLAGSVPLKKLRRLLQPPQAPCPQGEEDLIWCVPVVTEQHWAECLGDSRCSQKLVALPPAGRKKYLPK